MSKPQFISADVLRGIRGVCFDLDDTVSTHGKLTSEAFDSLWRLKHAGFRLVMMTGRPAGWCDHFARFWPIDAVVGENGAFTFLMQAGKRVRLDTPGILPKEERQVKLQALRERLERTFPTLRFASDQSYREQDLAIDLCEDVVPASAEWIQKVESVLVEMGATYKISSIHLNAWYGHFDKWSGFEHWRRERENVGALKEWVYVGDSPNDEPLFQHFKHSVGVANIAPFLPKLRFPPKYVTHKESGEGFCELTHLLLQAK